MISEIKERERRSAAFVENKDLTKVGQYLINHFKKETGAGHVGSILVLGEDGSKAGGFPEGIVDSFGGIALCLGNDLLGLTLGSGNDLVATFLCLVDESFLLLFGLVDLVESWFDRIWRGNILQLNGANLDPDVEAVEDFLKFDPCLGGDLDAFFGEYIAPEAIANDPAHDCFGNIANGLLGAAGTVNEGGGITDPVLNDPLHVNDLEIASKHEALGAVGAVLAVVGSLADAGRSKAKLLLQNPCTGDFDGLVNSVGKLEAQARFLDGNNLSESFNDCLFLWLYGVDGSDGTEADEENDESGGTDLDVAANVFRREVNLNVNGPFWEIFKSHG